MIKLLKLFVFFMVNSVIVLAHAKGPDAVRIEEAKVNLQKFIDDGQELTDRQHLQFSLKAPMAPIEVERYAERYKMQVEFLNFCTGHGGSSQRINPARSLSEQASALNLAPLRNAALKDDDPASRTDGDLSPSDLKLCGFEARLPVSELAAAAHGIDEKIFAIEVIHRPIRISPINRWRLYLD